MSEMPQRPSTPPPRSVFQRDTSDPTELNGLSLASFVLGIVSLPIRGPFEALLAGDDGWRFLIALLIPIAGAAAGYLAMRQIDEGRGALRGREMALAGLVLSIVGAIVMLLTFVRVEGNSDSLLGL